MCLGPPRQPLRPQVFGASLVAFGRLAAAGRPGSRPATPHNSNHKSNQFGRPLPQPCTVPARTGVLRNGWSRARRAPGEALHRGARAPGHSLDPHTAPPAMPPPARWGRRARPIKSSVASSAGPFAPPRAGWATRAPQAGPPRHDRRLVHELKREASAATPPALFNWRRNPRTREGKHVAARSTKRHSVRSPRRAGTLHPPAHLRPATPLCSAPLARPSCAGGQIAQVEWSGVPPLCSLNSPAADHAEPPWGGWRWQSPFQRPLTSSMPPRPVPRAASAVPRHVAGRAPRDTPRAGSPPHARSTALPCRPSSREPRAVPPFHLPPLQPLAAPGSRSLIIAGVGGVSGTTEECLCLCSTRVCRHEHAEPLPRPAGGDRRRAHPPAHPPSLPRPCTPSPGPAPLPPYLDTWGSPRHATRRLAAARPLNCAALPTLLTRAARRPSIHLPPPQPLAAHRSSAHPSPLQVAIAGAVEVRSCPPCAARLALREPRGAAAVPAGRDSRRARPPAAVGADHPHPLPRRS